MKRQKPVKRKTNSKPRAHATKPVGEVRPLILVVDDFKDNREMYAEYLAFAGFRVAEAEDGKEALERTIDLEPDAIIMDLALPKMDGLEVTKRIRANASTAKIPILVLTGHALSAISKKATQAGADAFLVKPCLPDALAREIRRVLGSRDATERKDG